MNTARILLVDDHQLIIDGLRDFISVDKRFTVVGEANNGNEAVNLAKILSPNIILMDIEMPGMSGIAACELIKKNHPAIKIIIVSQHDEKELIKKLVDLGADGYLLKNSSRDEVMKAIETVVAHKKYFSQDVTMSLLNKSNNLPEQNRFQEIQLTDREIEILKLIAEGLTNKEIGDNLSISHRTVDTHRTNLMKKLEVTNVAGLIRFAFQKGLIQ